MANDARKGGIKRRLLSGCDLDASSSACPSGGASKSIRRRVAEAAGPVDIPEAASLPFNLCMRRDWAKGLLPSNRVLEYSATAATQGASNTFQMRPGWTDKTAHRDLIAALGWPSKAPEFSWIMIPKGPSGELQRHPVVCPIDSFTKLYHDHPTLWRKRIEGPKGSCGRFWRQLSGHDIVRKHPVLKPSMFEKTIPLGLHGDGAPVYKHESLFTISWNSLQGRGTTIETRFVFTAIRKSQMGVGTLVALWTYFAFAMNVLLSGVTPSTDWTGAKVPGGGKDLADGWRAACIEGRGDWEFYASALDLPRWDEVENCCWICKASLNLDRYPWTDFSPTATWRKTIRTHESWLRELAAAGEEPSTLFRLLTGFRLECIMVDTLHACDQGMSPHVLGNVFVEVMSLKHWGNNQKLQVEGLQAEMKAWYAAQPKEVKSSKLHG